MLKAELLSPWLVKESPSEHAGSPFASSENHMGPNIVRLS